MFARRMGDRVKRDHRPQRAARELHRVHIRVKQRRVRSHGPARSPKHALRAVDARVHIATRQQATDGNARPATKLDNRLTPTQIAIDFRAPLRSYVRLDLPRPFIEPRRWSVIGPAELWGC